MNRLAEDRQVFLGFKQSDAAIHEKLLQGLQDLHKGQQRLILVIEEVKRIAGTQ
jgi:hypothetical protein